MPYLVLTLVEFCTILLLMRSVFQVPIHGHVLTLLALTLPFVLSIPGAWALWISTRVSTRDAARQMAMGTMLPSIFLSGYVFPLDSMPIVLLVRGPGLPDDVADRRGPRRDPARSGDRGSVGPFGGAVGDGAVDVFAGDAEV